MGEVFYLRETYSRETEDITTYAEVSRGKVTIWQKSNSGYKKVILELLELEEQYGVTLRDLQESYNYSQLSTQESQQSSTVFKQFCSSEKLAASFIDGNYFFGYEQAALAYDEQVQENNLTCKIGEQKFR